MDEFEIEPELPNHNVAESIQAAWNHIDNGEYDAAVALVEQFAHNKQPDVIYNYHKIRSAATFRMGDYDIAKSEALIVTKMDGVKANDWFDLCTCATMNQNISLGEDAFNNTVKAIQKNPDSINSSIPQILFYYIQVLCAVNEIDKAFEQLDRLKNVYTSIKNTDPTYLQDVGVPFLSNTLDAGMPIFTHIGQEESQAWLNDFANQLDNEGMHLINQFKTGLCFN